MINIQKLSKVYAGGFQALKDIDLSIESGMFGLLGPNGAGKTTLMRLIAGLIKASTGNIQVFGHDISTPAGKQAAKALIGYLPQDLGLYPNLSAREFLDYIAILKGVSTPSARQTQIDELIELVRLSDKQHHKLKTFSGGMKRRIGIAQALLGNPRLLIVDEPSAGLDPEERVRLRNLLAEMSSRCIVILSTHVIEDISHSCNDLAIINQGSVLYRGAPAELIQQARGKVWNILTHGEYPEGLSVVSTIQLQSGVQYRVLGTPATHYQATPLEPSLEDGYMWMMQQQRASL